MVFHHPAGDGVRAERDRGGGEPPWQGGLLRGARADRDGEADGAAKGDVALTLQTVPIKVALPAPIGTQKIPGVGPARLDVDVNLLPGKAIAEIRKMMIERRV